MLNSNQCILILILTPCYLIWRRGGGGGGGGGRALLPALMSIAITCRNGKWCCEYLLVESLDDVETTVTCGEFLPSANHLYPSGENCNYHPTSQH